MKVTCLILAINLNLIFNLYAQDVFTGGIYTQNFGNASIAAWTNNTTFLGWYIDNANFQGTFNVLSAVPPVAMNAGGQYMYRCNGGTDMKLGTRPSNGSESGTGPCANLATSTCGHGVGVRLLNTFGNTIVSISVSYDWHQFTTAEDGNNQNGMFFSYQKGATVTNLTTGVWTNIPTLDFLAPLTGGVCSSNQLMGYPCTVTGSKMDCFVVNVPQGNEIMLRWWDPNNSCNDPHLGIDNIIVTAYADNICLTPLSVELIDFFASRKDDYPVELKWSTASEKNNNYFTIERSSDGINFEAIGIVKGNGNSYRRQNYDFTDQDPKSHISYYRLKQTDFSNQFKYSKIVAVNSKENWDFDVFPNPSLNGEVEIRSSFSQGESNLIEVLDYSGKKLAEQVVRGTVEKLNLSAFGKGMYILRYNRNGIFSNKKLILN